MAEMSRAERRRRQRAESTSEGRRNEGRRIGQVVPARPAETISEPPERAAEPLVAAAGPSGRDLDNRRLVGLLRIAVAREKRAGSMLVAAEVNALAGGVPATVVARELGMSRQAVEKRAARRRLGVRRRSPIAVVAQVLDVDA